MFSVLSEMLSQRCIFLILVNTTSNNLIDPKNENQEVDDDLTICFLNLKVV